MVILACSGVYLYAVLMSIHQFHPITDAMISNSPDSETTRARIAERDRRSEEERKEKLLVAGILGVDVAMIALVAIRIWRPSAPSTE